MYVSGFSSASRRSSSRTSASCPENLDRNEPPCRRASSSTTIQPALCRSLRVLSARVAEPDDEQVERRGRLAPTEEAHYPSESDAGLGLRFALGRLALGLALRCFLALGQFLLALLGLGLDLDDRGGELAITVSCGSSRKVTPSIAAMSSSRSVSPISMRLTSASIDSGTSIGSASTLTVDRGLLRARRPP